MFGCTFEISKRVPETIVKAFADALPERVSAGGFGSGNNMSARFIDPATGKESLWYNFYEGGQGATAHADGNNGLYFWAGTALNQPIEVWEHKYPSSSSVALVPGSGGDGAQRGGLGTVHEIRLLADHFLSGLGDRHRVAPVGHRRRQAGAAEPLVAAPQRRTRAAGGLQAAEPVEVLQPSLKAGDVLIIETGGGGGYGDQRERRAAALERDRRDGYVLARHDVPAGADVAAILERLAQRRSCRAFDGSTMPRQSVEAIIRDGLQAPSSCNQQQWHFVAIDDSALKRRAQEIAGGNPHFLDAAVIIYLCFQKGWTHDKFSVVQSVAGACYHMMLSAHLRGYDSIWNAGIGDTRARGADARRAADRRDPGRAVSRPRPRRRPE